jgi:hypothetical protein
MVQPGTPRLVKGLPPLTQKQLRDAERDKLYIFNTSPRTHRIDACGKRWTIPPCAEGQDVSDPLEVPGAYYFTDVAKVHGLDVDYKWVTVDGTDLARDIIGTSNFQHESNDLTRWGVFVSDTPHPSQDKIDAARERWYERCSEKVQEADRAYAINSGMVSLPDGRSISEINKDHIEAAKILGLERAWATKNPKLTTCDECGTGNLPTAAFCKQCDNMLNAEAAQRKFPAKYAERMGPTEPVATPEVPAKRAYTRRTEVA